MFQVTVSGRNVKAKHVILPVTFLHKAPRPSGFAVQLLAPCFMRDVVNSDEDSDVACNVLQCFFDSRVARAIIVTDGPLAGDEECTLVSIPPNACGNPSTVSVVVTSASNGSTPRDKGSYRFVLSFLFNEMQSTSMI